MNTNIKIRNERKIPNFMKQCYNYSIYYCFHNRKAKFVKDNGYGGVIIWEIGMDDIKKECSSVDYPLLRAINNGLFDRSE